MCSFVDDREWTVGSLTYFVNWSWRGLTSGWLFDEGGGFVTGCVSGVLMM